MENPTAPGGLAVAVGTWWETTRAVYFCDRASPWQRGTRTRRGGAGRSWGSVLVAPDAAGNRRPQGLGSSPRATFRLRPCPSQESWRTIPSAAKQTGEGVS